MIVYDDHNYNSNCDHHNNKSKTVTHEGRQPHSPTAQAVHNSHVAKSLNVMPSSVCKFQGIASSKQVQQGSKL